MHNSIKVGDRVRFIKKDGTLSEEAVEVHDVFGNEESAANFSFFAGGGMEQIFHSDLVHLDGDTSPVKVPEPTEWYIAVGNAQGWGRSRTAKQAVANMKRQGGKPTAWVVYRVNQWTKVNDMGGLTWPQAYGEPVEVSRIEPKKAKRA
jgi:hypothetical protein